MSRRFALISLTMFLCLLVSAPLWAAKGGNGGGGGGKPPKDDPPPEPPPFEYVLQILPLLDDGDPDTPLTGQVLAMNNHGDMVGWTGNTAVLWTDDGLGEKILIPLNSLLPEGSEWSLWWSEEINDSGQIACNGFLPSETTGRPVRFTPPNGTDPAIVDDLSTIGMVEVTGINIH